MLKKAGIRVTLDDRDNYNPGWKFNNWELKGVPLRVELGKKDFQDQEVKIVRRDNGEKVQIKWDQLVEQVPALLE